MHKSLIGILMFLFISQVGSGQDDPYAIAQYPFVRYDYNKFILYYCDKEYILDQIDCDLCRGFQIRFSGSFVSLLRLFVRKVLNKIILICSARQGG